MCRLHRPIKPQMKNKIFTQKYFLKLYFYTLTTRCLQTMSGKGRRVIEKSIDKGEEHRVCVCVSMSGYVHTGKSNIQQ